MRLGRGELRDLLLNALVPTTCLFIPSSFGSKPRARPIICGKCSTGMPRSRSTNLAASGCWRSRFRWHSGQGVTTQSAPASTASAMWRPACFSEVSRFIVITGKPQHLWLPAYSTGVPPMAVDDLLHVLVALGVFGVAQAVGGAHDVAAVERGDP